MAGRRFRLPDMNSYVSPRWADPGEESDRDLSGPIPARSSKPPDLTLGKRSASGQDDTLESYPVVGGGTSATATCHVSQLAVLAVPYGIRLLLRLVSGPHSPTRADQRQAHSDATIRQPTEWASSGTLLRLDVLPPPPNRSARCQWPGRDLPPSSRPSCPHGRVSPALGMFPL